MHVTVRFFAALREVVGRDSAALALPAGATPEDAFRTLCAEHPGLAARRAHLTVAVNRRYAAFDSTLREGDELVFIPPVSGGAF
jgi:molybdopterin converting factor subunit 1